MNVGQLALATQALGQQIHEQLMPDSGVVIRGTPTLTAQGKIDVTKNPHGTIALCVNAATAGDAKLVEALGMAIEYPFMVARIPLAADVKPDDLIVVAGTVYRVKGINKGKAYSAIRRAYLVEE